ncbi:MAG TPA: RND transporter [Rhodobacteraceae bacterium]|nr:RND transporter [Paracoccaceae bacterium]
MKILDQIPFPLTVMMALTLGLAPFAPEPHVVEKLRMLFAGNLVRPVDMFDLVMHGAPWLVLFGKLLRLGTVRNGQGKADD